MIFLVAKELNKPLSMVCVCKTLQSDGENEKEKKTHTT